jgi:hypothetical protein
MHVGFHKGVSALPPTLRRRHGFPRGPLAVGSDAFQLPPTLRGPRGRGTYTRERDAFHGCSVRCLVVRFATPRAASAGCGAASAAARALAAVRAALSFSKQHSLYLRPEPQ